MRWLTPQCGSGRSPSRSPGEVGAWGQFKWWRLRDVAVAAADVVCRPVQERKVAKRRGAAFVLRGGREDGIHRLLVREDVPHPVAADRDERAVDDVNLDRVAMREPGSIVVIWLLMSSSTSSDGGNTPACITLSELPAMFSFSR